MYIRERSMVWVMASIVSVGVLFLYLAFSSVAQAALNGGITTDAGAGQGGVPKDFNPEPTQTNTGSGQAQSGSGQNPGQPVTYSGNGKITNPVAAGNIPELILKVIDVILIFALPIIVLFIMFAGFKFVTAQGNPSEIESARSALLWAIVGGVIVFGAHAIIAIIQETAKNF